MPEPKTPKERAMDLYIANISAVGPATPQARQNAAEVFFTDLDTAGLEVRAKSDPTPPGMDTPIHKQGIILGEYPPGTAAAFAAKVDAARLATGKDISWHYMGDKARVRCFAADADVLRPYFEN